VGQQIRLAEGRIRPAWIQQQRLPAKLLRDTEAFEKTQPGDAFAPVGVLVLTHCLPISGNELANTAGDHTGIVRPMRPETESTMTNAAVTGSAATTNGRTMRLKYATGEVEVDMTSKTAIVTLTAGDRSLGFVLAVPQDGGGLNAVSIVADQGHQAAHMTPDAHGHGRVDVSARA
jgi:hypothetical protein